MIHVLDTGVGIDRREIPHLFNTFSRHSNLEKQEGIGLGLTISKRIVESSGGTIKAESKGLNQGALFIFTMRMEIAVNSSGEESKQTENNVISTKEERKGSATRTRGR